MAGSDGLLEKRSLHADEARQLVIALTEPDVPPPLAGALLAAIRAKGVTADELRGFALGMRSLARRPAIVAEHAAGGVDIVGTGGDKSGSFNLSTGASLLRRGGRAYGDQAWQPLGFQQGR